MERDDPGFADGIAASFVRAAYSQGMLDLAGAVVRLLDSTDVEIAEAAAGQENG